MYKNKKIAVILFIIIISISSTYSDTIKLTADIWAPYTMNPNSGRDGYLIDIARAAFQLFEHEVIFELSPYSRGIIETKNGTYDGVVGIYRKDAQAQNLITPHKELGISINTFYVKLSDSWKYDNILKEKSLKGKMIGVIQNYIFSEIEEYLQANKNTSFVQYTFGEDPLKKNLTKLINNRLDIIIDDQTVVIHTAKQMGISNKIKKAGSLSAENHIVIGFSKSNPRSVDYAEMLSQGIEILRESGELEKILDSYGLDDWKQ